MVYRTQKREKRVLFAVIICTLLLPLLHLSCSTDSRSINKGEASLRLGDHEMAIRFFDEVLHHNPENFRARVGMGKALLQQATHEQDDSTLWADALTHLEAARTLQPESDLDALLAEAWVLHARQVVVHADTLSALSALSRAIDLQPESSEALNLAGIIYFKMGSVHKATLLFERALAADTTRAFTWFNIGMLRWALDDVQAAHTAWFKAVTLSPDDKDIVYWFAVAEKRLQEQVQ